MNFWTLLLAGVLLATSVASQQEVESHKWKADEYPKWDRASGITSRCRSLNRKYLHEFGRHMLCDPDAVLTDDEADEVESYLDEFTEKTKSYCTCKDTGNSCNGFVINIAIVQDMHIENTKELFTAEQNRVNEAKMFTHRLQQLWQRPACGEDILIFYAEEKNVLYVIKGDTAHQYVAKGPLAQILNNYRLLFGPGRDPARGFRYIIKDLQQLITTGKYNTIVSQSNPNLMKQGGNSGSNAPSKLVASNVIFYMMFAIYCLKNHVY